MWGSSYLLIAIALKGFTPSQLASIRIGLAAIVLMLVMLLRRDAFPRGRTAWMYLTAIALIGNCIPFTLIAWGQQHVDSGLAAILAAATPLCVVGLAHFLLPEGRIGKQQLFGFVLGFGGVVVLMGPESLLAMRGDAVGLLSQLAVLGGAFCYALATVITAKMPEQNPLVASAVVMLIAGSLMAPISVSAITLFGEVPADALFALFVLGVMGTALTSILYFWLVARAGARFTSLFNYMVPMWAVMLGVLVLDEPLRVTAIMALAMIIVGVVLSQRSPRTKA